MKKLILSLVCLALVSNISAGLTKYDAELFIQGDAVAAKLIEAKAQILKDLKIRKVAIVECYGEFVAPREVQIGAREKKKWENREIIWAPVWTKVCKIDPSDDYYAFMVDRFYDLVRKIFEDNGITVIDREVIGSNDIYSNLNLGEELDYNQDKNADAKVYRRSSTGLRVFEPQVQIPLLAELAVSVKSDAIVRANFYADLFQGQPLIRSFSVTMYSDVIASAEGGYGFKRLGEPILKLKEPIISGMDILGREKKADIKKYDSAIFEILTSITVLFNSKVRETLS